MPKTVQQIANEVNSIRERAGLSATALAKAAGVSRQTIYAIEKGTYVPNTVVGLRLAQALSVTVEDLFKLPEQASMPQLQKAVVLPGTEHMQAGQPVQLCMVDNLLVAVPASNSWLFPASDATLAASKPVQGRTKVNLHEPTADLNNRILLAGCDPALAILARYLQRAGVNAILHHDNSSGALSLLKRGHVHVAGTHLQGESTGKSNIAAIQQHLPTDSVAVFSFAAWQEGLAIAKGNPKQITGVEDLARTEIRFLNRESGAGSRTLLDRHLQRLGMDPSHITGYDRTAAGHLASAWEVKRDTVDCCLSTQAAASFLGTGFIPLQTSRYDLVVRKQHLQLPEIQTLLDVLNLVHFRSELRNAGCYDTTVTGSRIL